MKLLEEPEDDKDIETDFKVCQTNYVRRPEHEAMLAKVLQMAPGQLLRELSVKKHNEAGYIASEVLVTLARAGYGTTQKVRDAIGLALSERVVKGFTQFLLLNPEWYTLLDHSSEAKKEAVSFTQLRLFQTTAEVSFAEVTFREFINCRFLDWCISQTRMKNTMPSVDALENDGDDDDNPFSPVNQLADEDSLLPHEQVELNQLINCSQAAVLRLPEKERHAVNFCFNWDFTQKQAAEYMGCNERSVRTYLKSALAKLKKGDWNE